MLIHMLADRPTCYAATVSTRGIMGGGMAGGGGVGLGFCLLALFGLGACKKDKDPAPAAAPVALPAPAAVTVAKVKVTNDGIITLNGRTVTVADLKTALTSPATRPASILYQRVNAAQDPTPEAAPLVHEVLTTIMDTKLPVRAGQFAD